jgi:hypothetical protein
VRLTKFTRRDDTNPEGRVGMGLRIDINTVARLLLQDGVWYEVLPGSLTVDSFEWTDSEGIVVRGADLTVEATTGLRFKTRGMNGWISCPLTSIVAVHYEPIELDDPVAVNIPAVLADEIDPHRG